MVKYFSLANANLAYCKWKELTEGKINRGSILRCTIILKAMHSAWFQINGFRNGQISFTIKKLLITYQKDIHYQGISITKAS